MSKKAKLNEKFKGDYLAMNIRETDIYEEGRNDGIAQGAEQKAIETARNMLNYGDPLEKIASITSLAMDTVEKLANEQKNQRKNQG